MTSQIAQRSAAPSRGLWSSFGKDWLAGALLVLVWTALWTTFTAGVLAPAASLGRTATPVERQVEGPGTSAAPAWVAGR